VSSRQVASSEALARIGGTPLVRLRSIGSDLPVPVLVKCEHLNPSGSVKDRIALAIVEDAERRGALRPGATIVEATAGNTGLGLALVAATRGYRVVCVMPAKMSADKRTALAAAGAEVIVTQDAPLADPRNFQQVARALAGERGWFLADQFANPANPRVHETATGPELLAQAGGAIGAFVAGAGTGGTLTGVGRYLRRACPSARVVLADPAGSGLADWVETGVAGSEGQYAIEGIGASAPPAVMDRSVIDAAERIPDAESFATVARLVREEGMLVGGSAGTAVAAALRVAARGVDGPVVALLPDSWDRYFSTAWLRELRGV
jgi:cysteine synthase